MVSTAPSKYINAHLNTKHSLPFVLDPIYVLKNTVTFMNKKNFQCKTISVKTRPETNLSDDTF
jgi:hypothetical protein